MNECKILGYARYTSKEDESEKLRINIAIPYQERGYNGYIPLKTIFLNYDKSLEDLLREAIDKNKNLSIDYQTRLASQKIEIVGFSELKESDNEIKTTIEDFI